MVCQVFDHLNMDNNPNPNDFLESHTLGPGRNKVPTHLSSDSNSNERNQENAPLGDHHVNFSIDQGKSSNKCKESSFDAQLSSPQKGDFPTPITAQRKFGMSEETDFSNSCHVLNKKTHTVLRPKGTVEAQRTKYLTQSIH